MPRPARLRCSSPSRRDVLAWGALATACGAAPRWASAQDNVVAETASARLEKARDGLWTLTSKPLEGGFDTICNGGFVAGGERVVCVEAFGQPVGAEWVLEQIRTQTGRLPSDVVLSHHHGDHVGGLGAFAALSEPPQVWTTEAMRARIQVPEGSAAAALLEEARLVDGSAELSLADSQVTLTALSGHTGSDLVTRVNDDATFFGDLVWNGLFPNFMDARPLELMKSVETLVAGAPEVLVAGHGERPAKADLDRFASLLGEVEAAARAGVEAGKSVQEVAAAFEVPASLGTWTLFSPNYFEVAFGKWFGDLGAG